MIENIQERYQLRELFGDRGFQSEAAQIQAKALLSEISDDVPNYRWTYISSRVIRNIVLATLAFEDLAANNPDEVVSWSENARTVALIWEAFAVLREDTNRETALLNAAINYEIAGYQANSAYIAKQLLPSATRQTDLSLLAMGSLFLQRRFLQLLRLCNQAQLEPNTEGKSGAELVELIGNALVGAGIASAVRFFLKGENESLQNSFALLIDAEAVYSELSLTSNASLVRGVRSLLPLMQQRATWTIFDRRVRKYPQWRRYLQLLARGVTSDVFTGRSVSELWPSQLSAIAGGLLDSQDSQIVRMPTSAGKTRIAELAIINSLVEHQGSKCVYVAPYRALVSELERSFLNLLSDLGFRVSSIVGTYESDDFEEILINEADVLITTPEKLDLLLRAQPHFLESVVLFVLDEAHILHDRQRGIKFEILLTRLKRKLPSARFLTLSAVVPDQTLQDFAQWFNTSISTGILISAWRPTIQRYAFFRWSGQTGTIEYAPEEDVRILRQFVPGVIKQRSYEYHNPATGRLRRLRFPDTSHKAQTAAELAFKFAEVGSVLVFCSQARSINSVADALAERIRLAVYASTDMPPIYQGVFSAGRRGQMTLPLFSSSDMNYFTNVINSRSVFVAREWLGNDHPVTQWLESGIGVHYGRLPDAVRSAIEADFRERKLRVLIATSTLAQGVNLPVRTVIVHSCLRYSEGTSKPIPARDYWNIAGRAGRAGEETAGLTIHLVNTKTDADNYNYYLQHRESVEPVDTALFQRLIELAQNRLSVDELRGDIDAEVLALLAEETETELPRDVVENMLDSSLTKIQANRSGRSMRRLNQAFTNVAEQIAVSIPDREIRTLYSHTGLSSSSCLTIRDHIVLHRDQLATLFPRKSPSAVLRRGRDPAVAAR